MSLPNYKLFNIATKTRNYEPVTPGEMPLAGTPGFGVGVYPGDEDELYNELGLKPLEGYDNPYSDNFGNYEQDSNTAYPSSIYVFIPKFYIRYLYDIEDTDTEALSELSSITGYSIEQLQLIKSRSPQDAFVIANASAFANQTEANAKNFILPRCFIDGGEEKSGFFIMKYLASLGDYSTIFANVGRPVVSVKNGVTVKVGGGSTTVGSTFYMNINYIANRTGISYLTGGRGAVDLAKTVNSNFSCATAFMLAGLNLLSKFESTVVTSTDYCAWYDKDLLVNFPKGAWYSPNPDDSEVSTTLSSEASSTPLTGSATVFEKTTHNGQQCGVTDVCGTYDVIGVGLILHSADSDLGSEQPKGYILKETTTLSELTSENMTVTSDDFLEYFEEIDIDQYFDFSTYTNRFNEIKVWGSLDYPSLRRDLQGHARDLNMIVPPQESMSPYSSISTEDTRIPEYGHSYFSIRTSAVTSVTGPISYNTVFGGTTSSSSMQTYGICFIKMHNSLTANASVFRCSAYGQV